jgi:hypothetical protein
VVPNVLDYVSAYACFYDIPMLASMTHLWATIRGIVISLRVLLLVPVRRKVWTFEGKKHHVGTNSHHVGKMALQNQEDISMYHGERAQRTNENRCSSHLVL